jgi:tetratricopeptide (TPR) repeat protein
LRRLSGLLAATLLIGAAGAAQAAVTVIGGRLATQCSDAAVNGETDFRFEQICTQALEGELLARRDRAGTFVNRGIIKLRRHEYEGAIRDFNFGIMAFPDLGEAYVNRGAADIGAKRFPEALTDLNKALELGVMEPQKAYYDRGLAHENLDDPVAAQLDFQKALELAPDWTLVKTRLARYGIR